MLSSRRWRGMVSRGEYSSTRQRVTLGVGEARQALVAERPRCCADSTVEWDHRSLELLPCLPFPSG